ncbi:MAG TPA: cupin domain-containing protein [Planctomycetaceae bacterium]
MPEPQRKAAFVQPGGGAHLAWLGERLRYLVVGEQTAGRLTVSAAGIPPGGGTASHVRHRDHVGFYVFSGEPTFSVGNRTLAVPAGGFLAVPPGAACGFENSGAEPAELLTFAAPAGFDEFQFRAGIPLPRADAPVPPMTDEDRETLAALASGYGVELDPSDAALRAEPNLRHVPPGEGESLAVVGDIYRFLAVSEDTEGKYALWHATVPPGGGPPWHSHSREDEAFYVLRGTVTFQADGATHRLGPGGFAHLPSGLKHRFGNETDEPSEMLVLVAPAGLERMFATVGRPWHDASVPPGPPDNAEIERLIEEAPRYGIELYL